MGWNKVKVFSATKAREREELGDVINRWIDSEKPDIVDLRVQQSSDNEFHCLSLVVLYR
jgi:hypothetical protein